MRGELSCDFGERSRQAPGRPYHPDKPFISELNGLPESRAVRLPVGQLGEHTLTRTEYYEELNRAGR